MKTFDLFKPEDLKMFEHWYCCPGGGAPVIDRKPDKSKINSFCENHNLNKDDVWKFHVYFFVQWNIFKNKKKDDFLKRGFESDLMKINDDIMKNLKIRKKSVNRISFLVDNATVNIENPLIIERIIKLMDTEFKGDIWQYHFDGLPKIKTKRSDSYPKEFIKGLKRLFEYFKANNPDLSNNDIYRLILHFILLIDPGKFIEDDRGLDFSFDWIKKHVK